MPELDLVVGDLAELSNEFRVDDVLTDPDTIALAVTTPEGVTTTYTFALGQITRLSAGVYRKNVPVAEAGDWTYVWTGTGAAADVADGYFTVRPTAVAGDALVDLGEVKDHLNIAKSNTSKDVELRRYINTATLIVEKVVGAVLPAEVVEWHDGGRSRISLRRRPVLSVQTVIVYDPARGTIVLTEVADPGAAVENSFTVDTAVSEIVRRTTRGNEVVFTAGRRGVKVEYTAGRTSIPENVALGAMELVRHLYQQTQQGGRPDFNGSERDGDTIVIMGYAVPRRVVEMLEPQARRRAGVG